MIVQTHHKAFLTERQNMLFKIGFDGVFIDPRNSSLFLFTAIQCHGWQKMAELRRQQHLSSHGLKQNAELTGLLAELAVQRHYGITAEQALENFSQGLSRGDNGIDLVTPSGKSLDVKSTALKDHWPDYLFNRNNRNGLKAQLYLFAQVDYGLDGSAVVILRAMANKQMVLDNLRPHSRYSNQMVLPLDAITYSNYLHQQQPAIAA